MEKNRSIELNGRVRKNGGTGWKSEENGVMGFKRKSEEKRGNVI